MPVCVVKLCKNNTSRNKKDTGITYHTFPADPVICDRWTAIVRLSRGESWWKPGKRSIICSAHFNESDFYVTKGCLKRLCKGAVPKNALFLSSTLPDNSTVTSEPSTSAAVVDSTSSVVKAFCLCSMVKTELSTSAAVIDSNRVVVKVEPSTSAAVVDSNSSVIKAEPSTSAADVGFNSSVVKAEPSTSAAVVDSNSSVVKAEPNISAVVINSNNSVVKAESSTLAAAVDFNSSVVKAEPSTSAAVVDSNSSVVTAEPKTSAAVVDSNSSVVKAELSITDPLLDDFSDIDYVFDTARIIKLKKKCLKQSKLQIKHGRIIKTLREKVRRLKKANCNLKSTVKSLKQELKRHAMQKQPNGAGTIRVVPLAHMTS